MRTNIVIDDKLMADALKASGYSTKKKLSNKGLNYFSCAANSKKFENCGAGLNGKAIWTKCEAVNDTG